MTPTDPAAPVVPPVAVDPSVDLLAEPTFEECVEHHTRYFDDLDTKRIDLTGIPDGHYIAYYNGRIHDHDADPTALLCRVAARLGVHPARVFVHYPWMW
jgi:hypothetical protein